MPLARPRILRTQTVLLLVVGIATLVVAGGWWMRSKPANQAHSAPSAVPGQAAVEVAHGASEPDAGVIDFPQDSWQAAGIKVQPVERGSFAQSVQLTGKITLNEDRVAHVFPLVEGRVDEVKIRYGDKVKKGDLLVVVQSREVGQAMLQLYHDRHQREFAVTKDRWTQAVTTNTQAMIKLIRDAAPVEEIEKQLHSRPMGEYRTRLMTAYIGNNKSRKHLDRLAPLSQDGAITGKQLLEAESEWNAARATLQSLVEQIQQDAQQGAALSAHNVMELQTRVSVDETNLKILGFDDKALANIDPEKQGETISHYPIHAPFDGTIITKDVVLLERVGPEHQILSIADLSTVWVTTDIYEEHLPLLKELDQKKIHLHSKAWPGQTFEAQIFYGGDVVNELSRTISMRAIADNRDGRLKPGMFVDVELPNATQSGVLQVPLAAIQEHEGKSFVFIHTAADKFMRHDVTLGRRNEHAVEILKGLQPGEMVVTGGGFALKSRMLADLLSE